MRGKNNTRRRRLLHDGTKKTTGEDEAALAVRDHFTNGGEDRTASREDSCRRGRESHYTSQGRDCLRGRGIDDPREEKKGEEDTNRDGGDSSSSNLVSHGTSIVLEGMGLLIIWRRNPWSAEVLSLPDREGFAEWDKFSHAKWIRETGPWDWVFSESDATRPVSRKKDFL